MTAKVLLDALTDTPCKWGVTLYIMAPYLQPERYDNNNYNKWLYLKPKVTLQFLSLNISIPVSIW